MGSDEGPPLNIEAGTPHAIHPLPKGVAEMMSLVNSAESLMENSQQEVVFDGVEEEVVIDDPAAKAKFKEAMIDHDSNARARSPVNDHSRRSCDAEKIYICFYPR